MTVLHDKPDLYRVFTQKCLDKFRYLAAYGCELTSTEEDRYVVDITYKNQTTGIKVSFEFRENQIFVYLIRLINGEIPAYLDAPSRWFYLDNLVKLRSPSTTLPRKEFGDWLTPDDIDDILTAYASALKEYGEDVLRGDFSVFTELAQQINRPKPSSSIDEVRLIGSNEEPSAQKERLLALEQEMKSVRVFAGSPGDTAAERNLITAIVDEINRDNGRREGYRIDLLVWEEDAYSDIGVDAQEVITRQIGDYDIFLGFMSTRFGSPTKRSNSGTEEEFNRAFEKYLQDSCSTKILFYFANPTVKLSEIDPDQVLQVRRFRDRIKDLGVLVYEYEKIEGTRGFRELVRRHLARAARELVSRGTQVAQPMRDNESGSQVKIVELGDWMATTQHIYGQSASYREVPLGQYSPLFFSLQGNFQSESPYFRFGFKLLTMAASPFGEATIQSRDDNLVLHIGKNTGSDEVFSTIYWGGLRVGLNKPFLNYRDRREIPIEISVSQDNVCRLIVDNEKLYEKQISRDITRRMLLVAWGDEHEYEVHFRNIRLEFA